VRLEGLDQLKKKKSNDLIGNRARDIPACTVVPQPTMLPLAPLQINKRSQFGHMFRPFLANFKGSAV
jgi:hypothetical protein